MSDLLVLPAPLPPRSSKVGQRLRAALLVALVAASVLRVAAIGRRSLWFDEILSITNATGGAVGESIVGSDGTATFVPADLWRQDTVPNVLGTLTWQDNGNGVVYGLLLHWWVSVFGAGDAVVRLPSAIAGVVVVVMVYRLGLLLFTPAVARSAALLALIHPLLIRYSQEARSYALATALTLIATECLLRLPVNAQRSPIRSGLGYGALAGAALLTHYLTASVFLAHGALAVARVRDGRAWKALLVAAMTAAVVVAVWMPLGGTEGLGRIANANAAYRHEALAGDEFARPSELRHVAEGIVQMTTAMSGIALQAAGLRLRYLAFVLALPLVVIAGGLVSQRLAGRSDSAAAVATLAASAPVCGLILAVRAGHVLPFQALYGNFATPYVLLLLGAGLVAAFPGTAGRWSWHAPAALAFLAVFFVSATIPYRDLPWVRPSNPYAEVAHGIARAAVPGDLVSFRTDPDARLVTLHLPVGVTVTERVDPGQAEDVLLRRAGVAQHQWTVPRYLWLARWEGQ